MNLNEFEIEIERLKKVYGAIKYPDERVSILFEKIGSLPISSFREQVSTFIASSEKAPMLGDFLNAFAGQLGDLKKQVIEAKVGKLTDCRQCTNTGHITCYEKTTGYAFIFQCNCPRGELLCPAYTKQTSNMSEKYVSHQTYISGRFDLAKTIWDHANPKKEYQNIRKKEHSGQLRPASTFFND